MPIDRRDLMAKMLMSGRALTICAPFAGPKRDGDIEDWARNLGGAAACYDVQRDATHEDLTWMRTTTLSAAAKPGAEEPEKPPRPAIPTAIPLEEAGASESCVFVIPREEGARRALAEALEERRGVNDLAGSH